MIKKVQKNIFLQDMTIHAPIESPCRVYSKHVVLKNIYSKIRLKK
jgi:hypothetical protein